MTGWQQSRPSPELGSARECARETRSWFPFRVPWCCVWTNTSAHAHTHTNWESPVRSLSFHADLLSLSNVWYAGIQAFAQWPDFYGTAETLVCVRVCIFRVRASVFSYACEGFLWIRHRTYQGRQRQTETYPANKRAGNTKAHIQTHTEGLAWSKQKALIIGPGNIQGGKTWF